MMEYNLDKYSNLDKKEKSLENIISDYRDNYDIDILKKQKDWEVTKWEHETPTLSELITMFGLESVISQLLEKYSIEQLLELLDIKDVQQFLRKKKLEQIKSDKDV